MLLSFAQFERELIGERVRDKIAASKRKGLWVGGPVPLGYAAVDKKIVVVPAEAEAVRTIFERYLELGSIRMLVADLDHKGIRSKPRQLSNGRLIGGGAFGVGALAYLIKNRFYIGEVVYRGEVHRGDHAPILNRPLFEAVQAKLAVQTVARRCRLRGSPALLTGRLFDDRGHCMSPSHTNKGGVRYRYYVSQAVLQGKPHTAGSVGRVPAAEVEAFVSAAVRKHLSASAPGEQLPENDLEILERLERVTLTSNHLELRLRQTVPEANSDPSALRTADIAITVPWTSPLPAAARGIIHVPAHNTPTRPSRREALLIVRRLAAGSTSWSTAVLAASPCLPGAKERPSGTSGCSCRSHSLHHESSRASSKGRRRQVLRSRRWRARCPGPGPSRSGALLYVAMNVPAAAAMLGFSWTEGCMR